MVELYAVYVSAINPFDKDNVPLQFSRYEDVSEVSFFKRDKTKEWFRFVARNTAKDKKENDVYSATFEEYTVHVLHQGSDKLCFIAICGNFYPMNTMMYMLRELQEMFHAEYGKSWQLETKDKNLELEGIAEFFKKYQDPVNFKPIDKAKFKIDLINSVLLDNVQELLNNQVKIDDLVEKSKDLSVMNKKIYKKASVLESKTFWQKCCNIF